MTMAHINNTDVQPSTSARSVVMDGLKFPQNLAFDSTSALHVTDSQNGRVLRRGPDSDSDQSNVAAGVGSSGIGQPVERDDGRAPDGTPTRCLWPYDICFSPEGFLLVVEECDNRITCYPPTPHPSIAKVVMGEPGQPNASPWSPWQAQEPPTQARGPYRKVRSMKRPRAICLNRRGDAYVCDKDNSRVLRFNRLRPSDGSPVADDATTNLAEHISSLYSKEGQVVAGGVGRVMEMNGFNLPVHIRFVGVVSASVSELRQDEAERLGVDPHGDDAIDADVFAVADTCAHRVVLWVCGEHEGAKLGGDVESPEVLAFDSNGDLYVASGDKFIIRFPYLRTMSAQRVELEASTSTTLAARMSRLWSVEGQLVVQDVAVTGMDFRTVVGNDGVEERWLYLAEVENGRVTKIRVR